MLSMGTVLHRTDGDYRERFMVVEVDISPSMALGDHCVFGLVKIPEGLAPGDLNQKFRFAPTMHDPTGAQLLTRADHALAREFIGGIITR